MRTLVTRMQTGWWQLKGERGQTTSEYLVIAGVIVAIIIAIGTIFSDELTNATNSLMGQVTGGAAS